MLTRAPGLLGLGVLATVATGGWVGYTLLTSAPVHPEFAVPVGFAGTLLAAGVWVARGNLAAHSRRITGWSLVGAVVLTAGIGFVVVHERMVGGHISDAAFLFGTAGTAGAVAGTAFGVYDARGRQARRELETTRARTRQLNEQLSVLNRVLRHDIRHEAQIIRGTADLLAAQTPDQRERLATIDTHADRLLELGDHAREIEQTLYESRDGCRRRDIAAVTREAVGRVADEHPDAVFDVSLPDRQPVCAHALLGSAVENVLRNAAEHADVPQPHVEVDLLTRAGDPGHVTLQVADDGPGIPEAELTGLEQGLETSLDHSSGLGLWLVRWIVTTAGGEVTFDTDAGDGTVVRLRFERAEAPA